MSAKLTCLVKVFALLLFTYLTVASSCSKGNVLTFSEISFGSGGGFTGAVTAFRITSEGEVFKTDSQKAEQLIKRLSKKEVNRIFKEAVSADVLNTIFVHPDNVYSFIKIKGKSKENYISWGDPQFKVDAKILSLYITLQNSIKQPSK